MSLSKRQVMGKRFFDFIFSFLLLIILFIPILVLIVIATISTGEWGLFRQKRIGYLGREFTIYKIRSLAKDQLIPSNWFNQMIRTTKMDELPQLFNVLIGNMSLVGPRPDVAGFADKLSSEDMIILTVKPGITGPASLKYKNEDRILAMQKDPEAYNETVIWPDKVAINKEYIRTWSFNKELKYLIRTFFD